MEATLRTVRHRGTGRRTANWPPRCNRRGGPPGFDVRAARTSGRGWTTRSIADATGLSQSTVCRIRRDHFPKSAIETGPKLAEQSAILAFVYVGPGRRVLAFHTHPRRPIVTATASPRPGEIADAVETVLCAALVPVTATAAGIRDDHRIAPPRDGDIPSSRSVTVALDFEPDNRDEALAPA